MKQAQSMLIVILYLVASIILTACANRPSKPSNSVQQRPMFSARWYAVHTSEDSVISIETTEGDVAYVPDSAPLPAENNTSPGKDKDEPNPALSTSDITERRANTQKQSGGKAKKVSSEIVSTSADANIEQPPVPTSTPPPLDQQDREETILSLPKPFVISLASLAGGWIITSKSERCRLFLTRTAWTGGNRASTKGCSTPTFRAISAWTIDKNRLTLKNANGLVIATLEATTEEEMFGLTNRQEEVSLSR